MTYPFVCFTVDNFDEAFSDIQVGLYSKSNFFQVRDGEMVAVELVARDTRGSMEAVLSLGCIQYDSTRSVVFFWWTTLMIGGLRHSLCVMWCSQKMLFASTLLLFEGYLWLVYSWRNCRVGWAPRSPGGLWPSTVAWDVTLGAWSPTNSRRKYKGQWWKHFLKGYKALSHAMYVPRKSFFACYTFQAPFQSHKTKVQTIEHSNFSLHGFNFHLNSCQKTQYCQKTQ